MDAEEYKFTTEWFDELGGVARKYLLTYFLHTDGTSEVSLFDYGKKRMFLKRTRYPDLRLEECFVGGLITVFGRQFKVVGYADSKTRQAFETEQGQVVTLLPPNRYYWGTALDAATSNGFKVTRAKTFLDNSGVSLAVEWVGKVGSVSDEELWHLLFPGMGRTALADVKVTRRSRESDQIFDEPSSTATYDNCSCLVVLPHAVKDGSLAGIVRILTESNFEISCVGTYALNRVEAEEFYEVYKGVIPQSDFAAKTLELSSGPCIAMEIRAENAVNELRALAGPGDVETAQKLRPNTIRAKFGVDKIKNAVHVTDLPDDAQLENQFFFDIMNNASSKK